MGLTLYTMTVLMATLLVMYHRISVMAIDTKCKVLSFCKQQNLGTQSSLNMPSSSVHVHIQNKLYNDCFAKIRFY